MGYKANIVTSLFTRFLGAFVTLGVSIITARELGTEKLGEISLVILAVAISILVSGIFSGPSLVYFTPRKKLRHLLIPSYVANVVCSIAVCCTMAFFDLYDAKYLVYAILISVIQSFFSTHFYVLLGLEKIIAYNLIGVIQTIVVIIVISIGIYVLHIKDVQSYFVAQAASFLIGFMITIPFIRQTHYLDKDSSAGSVASEIFKYGFMMQMASIFQQLNYRLSYYVIHWQMGDGKLGIFSLTMQIAEGVLIISRSIAAILFSKTANLVEKENIVEKTTNTLKFTYVGTFLFMIILLVFPTEWYELAFSKDFSEVKTIMWYISPGIMFLAIQTILSSYFSSVKKVHINTIGSLAGLIVIGVVVWPICMLLDLKGAAIANVLSYFTSMMIAIGFYVWVEKNRIGSLVFGIKDVKRYMKVFTGK
jgi:O-antigen/teichoic acid export membrane protein